VFDLSLSVYSIINYPIMKLEKNLSLSKYTTIGIGGIAKYMAFPENAKQV